MLRAIQRVLAWLGFRRGHPPPASRRDPFAWKPAPLRPHPKGRTSSVAVAEPDDDADF
jgi:hypothetical protein